MTRSSRNSTSGSSGRLRRRAERLAARATPVVLVHGLWMNGRESLLLRSRLTAAGFRSLVFRYRSTEAQISDVADQLAALLCTFGSGPVHLVGHSMGGLVILETLERHDILPDGRVVLLGSPVQGSRAARAIASWSLGPQLLGRLAAAELTRRQQCVWRWSRELGVIAGSRSVGMGRLFAELPAPNDGTVALEETQIPGANHNVVFDVSHTGMLVSRQVAAAVIAFLHGGRFGSVTAGIG